MSYRILELIFFIIADERREEQFNDIISSSMYSDIRKYVKFMSYNNLVKQYEKENIILSEEL